MTNKLQKAIELAVENGYLYKGDKLVFDDTIVHFCVSNKDGGYIIVHTDSIALDPQFWEALGKGLGWTHFGDCMYHPVGNLCQACAMGNWKDYMNNLMPYLQQGGTVEEYISSLID